MDRAKEALDAATRLLVSQIRERLYAAKAEISPGAWSAWRANEALFISAYQEVWAEALTSWNITDPVQRTELESLVVAALDDACARAYRLVNDLPLEKSLVQEEVVAFRGEFFLGVFLGEA